MQPETRVDDPAKDAQEVWVKTMSFGLMGNDNSIKSLLLKVATQLIQNTDRYWWAKHQYASVEDLAQKAEWRQWIAKNEDLEVLVKISRCENAGDE